MKALIATFLMLLTVIAACDLRSETAKREMENFSGTPTPSISPTPNEVPIDPADVVQVDTSLEGKAIGVYGDGIKRTIACTQLNRVMVNGNRSVISIKGACRQIMINGDGNQITSDAVMEFVINGGENTVKYSRYVNGKRPVVKENAAGNDIKKTAASGVTK